MAALTEDEVYRTSTQYRLWSFTPESLASLRATTNASAATKVRDAIRRSRTHTGANEAEAVEVDCLTVEEEQKLLGFYCTKAMELADFCQFPTNVKATAVQYLKRFYLSNSPMTYHPKQMMPSALFLATKTENHYTPLEKFASKLPKTTNEDVIAPEFLLTQGLRFTFDVRHPHRGLEGGFMELTALANGSYPSHAVSGTELRRRMLGIPPVSASKPGAKTTEEMKTRIQEAHGRAKDILKSNALLTDAYLLFTPSQIWFAALLLADEPLAKFYLDVKLSDGSPIKAKVLNAIQSCAKLISPSNGSSSVGDAEKKELTRIDKKLYRCRNPEKIDLVGINAAQKREVGTTKGVHSGDEDGGADEKVVKKRKMERDKILKEGEELFGPELKK
ncbi:hypothetical protein MMC25_000517 [Agyrium rufum]|nr:hypothetical protein [Agyrium rufum]